MAHPTRTGDLVAFSYAAVPVRRGDARHADRALGVLRPARLRAGRAGPRQQHEHARHVPGGRQGDRPRRRRRRPQHRPRADRGVPARHPGAAAQPGRRAARPARRRPQVHAAVDRRAERLPRSARPGDARRSTAATSAASAAPAQLATMFDEEAAPLPGPDAAAGRRRQRRRLAAELGAAPGHPGDRRRERVGPRRHQLRQPRVRLRARAHPVPPGAGELPVPGDQHRRDGPRAARRTGCETSTVFRVNGVRSA